MTYRELDMLYGEVEAFGESYHGNSGYPGPDIADDEPEPLGLPYETGTLLEQVRDSDDPQDWAETLRQIIRYRNEGA